MLKTRFAALNAIAVAGALLTGSSPSHAGAPVTYKMEGSFYEGCMGICQCIVTYMSPLQGTFRLQLTDASDLESHYAMTDVAFDATQYQFAINGDGTYTIYSMFAITHQLSLDTVYTSDGEPRHFESEITVVDKQFPQIEIKKIVNGDLDCYATLLAIDATPVFGDITGDAIVDVDDLLSVINQWGDCGKTCDADVSPEFTGNGVVDVDDLLTVINNWGL